VSLQDFRIGEWQPSDRRTDLSAFVPYCLDIANRRSCYVRAGGVKALVAAKFQYVHLRERATRIASVPWERGPLHRAQAPAPLFLFSIGRCGSTLLAEAFRAGGLVSLSEPDFYTQAVAGYVSRRGADRLQALSKALRVLTHDLLGICGPGSQSPAAIKLRAECCGAPQLIVQAEGMRSPTLFLVREFAPWAASMQRATTLSPERLVARYLEGIRCLAWLRRNTDCHLLLYEDLVSDPQNAIGAVASALDLELDPRRMKVAFKRDAQLGSPLSRKAVGERPLDTQRHAAALALWADAKSAARLKEVGLERYS
jgi:hypothetical protein